MRIYTLILLLLVMTAPCYPEQEVVKLKPLTPEQMSHKTVRVASVQLDSPWRYGAPYDPANCPADKVVPYIKRAGDEGADLVVFPELFLGLFKVPSPQTEKVSKAARENNINVIVGCFEIIDEQGNFSNSSLIFDREGEIIGRYFKYYPAVNVPQKADDPEALMTPGDEIPVFDLDFGRIGILTCYDGQFPELWRTLSLKGAEIIVWPNARGNEVQPWAVKTAMERNIVDVVTCNKDDGGGTMIAEYRYPPEIKVISKFGQEDFVIADLDMNNLRWQRGNSREFFQRREKSAAELNKRYEVWTMYSGLVPLMNENEEGTEENRLKLLEKSGITLESLKEE